MPDIRPVAVCFVLSLSVLSGCSRQPATAAPAALQKAAAAPSQPGAQSVTGTVVETLDAPNYIYLRVKADSGEVWAATTPFKVAVGDRVVVPLEMPMENFHSQTLNRDFPLIYFAPRIAHEGEPEPPALAVGHSPQGGGAPGAEVSPVAEMVAPVKGGTTVAKVWADRATLAGKTVTVRGKVVKFNGGILGKNWVHVQDGTGAKSNGSDDLTITTMAPAKVGEVIALTGTVAVKKDFGAGYAYEVMVEDATVAAQ